MIDPVIPDSPLELSAVLADDELVDRLSRRAGVSDAEPLARLLASWVSQVDAATEDDLAAAPVLAPVTTLTAVASRRRSRRWARGSRLAVAVTAVGVGLGSLTGVAAAVTGDPLAPYRPVIAGVLGGGGGTAGSGAAQSASTDPGAAEATTEGAGQPAAREGQPGAHTQLDGERPADAHGPAAVQAARDGWLVRWPGLPAQAVGPDPGVLDAQGGPSRADAGLRGPDSGRADQVRRDADKRPGDGGGDDENAASALRHGAGGSDEGGGSDRSGAPTTPPGHQVSRR